MIELVPFEESHFDLLIQWSPSAEFLLQWAGPGLDFPLTREQLAGEFAGAARPPRARHPFAARATDSGRIVGHGEIGFVDRRNRSARLRRILIGPAELRGKGHGEALVRALVRFAFEELDLHRLELGVFDFNQAAIRCYERVGFVREGTLRESRRRGDEWWSSCVMGLLRDEWRPQRS